MNFFRKTTTIAATIIVAASFVSSAYAGAMRGASGHKASGTARVSGNSVKLSSNFRFDGGPDVYVAIKKRGSKVKLISKLRKNSGAQNYTLPKGSKKSDVDQILLWCKKYNVPLGTATPN